MNWLFQSNPGLHPLLSHHHVLSRYIHVAPLWFPLDALPGSILYLSWTTNLVFTCLICFTLDVLPDTTICIHLHAGTRKHSIVASFYTKVYLLDLYLNLNHAKVSNLHHNIFTAFASLRLSSVFLLSPSITSTPSLTSLPHISNNLIYRPINCWIPRHW